MKPDMRFKHMRPNIDEGKCIECQKCREICPSNSHYELQMPQSTFAAYLRNNSEHKSSSSGGLASAIYEYTLANNGWISGVLVDVDLEPKFKLVNSLGDVQSFKGSKYVQVTTNDIYSQVLEKLKLGKKVTFIGLPCQCVAVRKMTSDFQDNLLTIDLICHGVPSQFTLFEHTSRLEKKSKKKVTSLKFRDHNLGVGLFLESNGKTFYKRSLLEDEYMHSFIRGDLFAECCYSCRYACIKRVGDLTIGDFWGFGKYGGTQLKETKVSMVLVNTIKGKDCWDQLKEKIHYEERTLEEAIDGNEQLSSPSKRGKNHQFLLTNTETNKAEYALCKLYSITVLRSTFSRKLKESGKRSAKLIANHGKRGFEYLCNFWGNRNGK